MIFFKFSELESNTNSNWQRGLVWLIGELFEWLVIQGSGVQATLDPLDFIMGVSLVKTCQSQSLVLVKPRYDVNNVSCCHDQMFNQSI